MNTSTAARQLEHEKFCMPRPGETEPRIESFTAERTDPAGRVTSRPTVTRCCECGSQVVEG